MSTESRKRRAVGALAGGDDGKKAKQDPPSKKSTEVTSGSDALAYLQVIITGPRGCGKSCLVLSYMGQLFPPSGAEFLSKQYLHILPNEQRVMIWDLDARGEFKGYRKQSYREADIALLCFDIKKPKHSIEEMRMKRKSYRVEDGGGDLVDLLRPWYTELEIDCKQIPIILVGLKGDIRVNPNICFSPEEINYAKRILERITNYKEVSAHTNRNGVTELFTTVMSSIEPGPKEMFVNRGFEFLRYRF